MAKWWELAIPAGGTLLGAVVGAGSQLILRRSQARHDRAMKLLDDKKSAYARFSDLTVEVARLVVDMRDADEGDEKERLLKRIHDLLPVIRDTAATIRMLAPDSVRIAAGDLEDAASNAVPGPAMQRLYETQSAFDRHARCDLLG